MKTTKIYAITFWLIVIVGLTGLVKYVFYQVDMYYSNLAPKQFEGDSAYSLLKFHGTVNSVVWILYLLCILLILIKINKIRLKEEKKEEVQ